ncbi:hypothetical protein NA645_14960 [Pseudomonas stutzeri]|uniref:hypothetical protein n=1 Tax=Stutzerimonas stutzeri TaxID=316 RepID=UPI002108CBEA|nr:hypothetical protein [Stutzerimonas stutzeri]MCQ4309290.1 hypothetical protein [Stutzerimonas stutzeri]
MNDPPLTRYSSSVPGIFDRAEATVFARLAIKSSVSVALKNAAVEIVGPCR